MTTTIAVRPSSTTPNMKPPPAPIAPATNAPSSSGMSSSPTIALKRPPSNTAAAKQRKDAQRPSLASGQHSTETISRGSKRKLVEPYVRTTEHILKKFAGRTPSLVLHLFPTHFRFDQQDGNFGYNSPMKIILDHVKSQTVPHEMIEELLRGHVPFYDGCLIVEIHNHKAEPTTNRNAAQDVNKGHGFVPFSLHNYNEHVTPSPYVPYPTPSPEIKSEQKDASSAPMESSRSSQGRDTNGQRNIFTTVLHPTQLSRLKEMAYLATQHAPDRSRKSSALAARDGTNSPSTPLTAATQNSRQPSAKRQKMLLEEKDIHIFESLMIQASEPPLFLEPAKDFAEARTVMKALTHPLHDHVPIRLKGRKRTTAELAADEAQAAEEERVALIMDERVKPSLSSNTSANAGPSDASNDFVPNFSRFKALEDIKRNHEEESLRRREHEQRERQEARARTQQHEALEKQQKDSAARLAQQQQDSTKQQLLQRQAMAQAQAQAQAQVQAQTQAQTPAQAQAQQGRMNPMSQHLAQTMQASLLQAQAQQQLLQQQGQAQPQLGQQGSPALRGQTPQQSSPAVSNIPAGQAPMSVPMAATASSQGHAGSPARPASALHMQGQAPMVRQLSQQTQMQGTPQMPQMTPLMPNGQAGRHITPQPRPSQASPPPGSIQGTPMMNMPAAPPINVQQMNPQQQQQALMMQQRRAAQMAAHAQSQGQMQGSPQRMPNQMSPQQQQAMMQAQQQAGSPQIQNMQGQNGLQNMQAQAMNQQQAQQQQQQQIRAALQEQYRKNIMQQQSNAQANALQMQNSGMQQAQRPQQQQQQQNMNPAMNGFNPNLAAMAQNMARNPSQAQAAMMMQQNAGMMNGNQMQPNQMVNVSQAQRALVNRQAYEKERAAYFGAIMQANNGQLPANAQAQFDNFRKKQAQQIQLRQAQQQQMRMAQQIAEGAVGNMNGNPLLTPGGGQMFPNGMQMGNMQAAMGGPNMDPNMATQIARQRSMAIAMQRQKQQQAQAQAQQAQQGNMMRQAMQGQNMNGQGMNGQGMG